MSILIATLKPGPPGADWSNFSRLKLLNNGRQKTWELEGGSFQPLPGIRQGTWNYDSGNLTIRAQDTLQSLVLRNVHWNFEALCTRQDLTGPGSRDPGGEPITWVLGDNHHIRNWLVLKKPRLVVQITNTMCWAAAIESWTSVVLGHGFQDQSALNHAYSMFLNADGSLGDAGWRKLADDFDIQHSWTFASMLSEQDIRATLRNRGHMIIIFDVAGADHANVIYGIGQDEHGKTVVNVMDPSAGEGFKTKRLDEFHGRVRIGSARH